MKRNILSFIWVWPLPKCSTNSKFIVLGNYYSFGTFLLNNKNNSKPYKDFGGNILWRDNRFDATI